MVGRMRACEWLFYCLICIYKATVKQPLAWGFAVVPSDRRRGCAFLFQSSQGTRMRACEWLFYLLIRSFKAAAKQPLEMCVLEACVPYSAITWSTHASACEWLLYCLICSFKAAAKQPRAFSFAMLRPDGRWNARSIFSHHEEHAHLPASGCFIA